MKFRDFNESRGKAWTTSNRIVSIMSACKMQRKEREPRQYVIVWVQRSQAVAVRQIVGAPCKFVIGDLKRPWRKRKAHGENHPKDSLLSTKDTLHGDLAGR
jgi:hypothetical protein